MPHHRTLIAISGLAVLLLHAYAQTTLTPQTPYAALISQYLSRDANGHSPQPDEIAAMASLQPTPDLPSIQEALPLLLKALANPDIPLHTFALNAFLGLQTAPPISEGAPSPTPLPSAFSPEIAHILTPAIPAIAAHLTSEDASSDRLLTASVLGGFSSGPPPAVFPALLAYLKRDDAVSPVGQAVVADLLQLGPISPDTTAAITRFLRRPDQTSDSRANLVDLIASQRTQSQSLNKSLLLLLDADDNSLRARIILSLPQLDLAPDTFAEAKSRVEQLAQNPNEALQVTTAAKSVAPCWKEPHMASGCPAY